MTEAGKRRGWTAYGLALIPIALWGSSFAAVKILLADLSPIGVAWSRAVVGLVTLLAIRLVFRPTAADDPRPGDGRLLVVAALMSVVAQTLLQAWALRSTSAIHSGWLITLIPIFTAILSAALLAERFPPLKIVGAALGFAGALVVMFGGTGGARLAPPSTRGDLLVVLSALNWAVYTLVARGLVVRRPPLAVTLRTLGLGAAFLSVPYALFGNPSEIVRLGPRAWAALAFLGVGCTGIGWLSWSAALDRLEPGTLTSFQYLQPFVTVASASVILGEPVTAHAIAGGALALGGVFLVQRSAWIAGIANRGAAP